MSISSPFRLGLISMPWSLFNRPSIQLGALKSYLEQQENFQVDTYHPYLLTARTIGTKLYSDIGLSGWAGEALFAPLLFPEQRTDAEKLFKKSLTAKTRKESPDFNQLVHLMEKSFTQWLDGTRLSDYDLLGFSICFSQLLPSLYLAKKIKEQQKDIKIVFGGSSCSGAIGQSLIDHFTGIDYLVDGEGEQPLLQLCQFLSGRNDSFPARVRYQKTLKSQETEGTNEEKSTKPLQLNDLPSPDYNRYFQEMNHYFPGKPFIPILPIEFSRGCWWNKCTFCNLNLQWHGYRFKDGARMLAETLQLSARHQCLHFTFTDNALPPKDADLFFEKILEIEQDFDFFAEIRGIAEPEKLQLYSQAGLKNVQVGIEALSTSMLTKMVKGTSAIDNIAMMKLCSGVGIALEGNIITDFPGTTEEEIDETLENLDFVLPFLPLQTASFFLGYGSPIEKCPKNFSISQITAHPKNRQLFPLKYIQSMTMLINSYRGDKKQQQKLWGPVKKKIAQWHLFHKSRTTTLQSPLSYRDGGSFLIIRQERISGPPLLHRLQGSSRQIYLACEKVIEIDHLMDIFPKISRQAMDNFICDLCSKRLMFQEDRRVLALAIRHKNC